MTNKGDNIFTSNINRLNSKRDLIITSSSPSHDLSNLLFISNYQEYFDSYSIHFFYFLNKPSKFIKNNPEEIYKFINKQKIYFTKIENNFFSRLYGFFIVNKIIIKTLIKKIINITKTKKQNFSLLVVQPRPYWLKQRFGLLSKLIFNYETIIVGDGVGSECLTKKPFWLQKTKDNNYISEKIISSYFIFSSNREKESSYLNKIHFHKHSSEDTKICFKNYSNFLLSSYVGNQLNDFINKIISNTNEIYFLLTSTFSEYGRCDFETEINLYKKEIKNLSSSGDKRNIIIKSHPLSSNEKNNSLLKLQEEINYFNSELRKSISKNFKLISYVPIEVLTTIFISKGIKVNIWSSSAALIPSLYAYPEIKYKILFGSKKIQNSFTNKNEILKRNHQEKIIKDICSNIRKSI